MHAQSLLCWAHHVHRHFERLRWRSTATRFSEVIARMLGDLEVMILSAGVDEHPIIPRAQLAKVLSLFHMWAKSPRYAGIVACTWQGKRTSRAHQCAARYRRSFLVRAGRRRGRKNPAPEQRSQVCAPQLCRKCPGCVSLRFLRLSQNQQRQFEESRDSRPRGRRHLQKDARTCLAKVVRLGPGCVLLSSKTLEQGVDVCLLRFSDAFWHILWATEEKQHVVGYQLKMYRWAADRWLGQGLLHCCCGTRKRSSR